MSQEYQLEGEERHQSPSGPAPPPLSTEPRPCPPPAPAPAPPSARAPPPPCTPCRLAAPGMNRAASPTPGTQVPGGGQRPALAGFSVRAPGSTKTTAGVQPSGCVCARGPRCLASLPLVRRHPPLSQTPGPRTPGPCTTASAPSLQTKVPWARPCPHRRGRRAQRWPGWARGRGASPGRCAAARGWAVSYLLYLTLSRE